MIDDHDDARDARLEQLAQRLGTDAAERLDVERVAAAVAARLRAERLRPVSPAWLQPAWLRVAAILVVVIGTGLLMRQSLGMRGAPLGTETVVLASGDLADLSPDQLQDVLATLDEPVVASAGVGDAGLEDLTEPQLQTLLHALED